MFMRTQPCQLFYPFQLILQLGHLSYMYIKASQACTTFVVPNSCQVAFHGAWG